MRYLRAKFCWAPKIIDKTPCQLAWRNRNKLTCQKCLCKEEPWDPEYTWWAIVKPVWEELEPGQQIIDIWSKRLQRRIGFLLPKARNFPFENGLGNLLQFNGHHHKTLDGFAYIRQWGTNDTSQTIEAHHLLNKYCVHTLQYVCVWKLIQGLKLVACLFYLAVGSGVLPQSLFGIKVGR